MGYSHHTRIPTTFKCPKCNGYIKAKDNFCITCYVREKKRKAYEAEQLKLERQQKQEHTN